MTVSPIFSNKMAVKMGLFWFSLILSIIGINAKGQFEILYKPDSLEFAGSEQIRESLLKEVFSASLGLSSEEYGDWDGLYLLNPFNTPEAAVVVYVDGVPSLGNFEKSTSYPLVVDEFEPDIFESVRDRIKQRFTKGNKLVNIKLSSPDSLQEYAQELGDISVPEKPKRTLNFLKLAVEEDRQFLDELGVLKVITDSIIKNNLKADNAIDFFNFRFTSLHTISDFHGENSPQTKEAKNLLKQQIEELNDALVKAYDGRVLVTVVSTDVAHTRRTVRAAVSPAQEELSDLPMDSSDYPAIFNIILWLSVALMFTMLAIVYTIMDMDPGRDSIIYRMTSTRMKKEN